MEATNHVVMSDFASKSYLRDKCGPRAVDALNCHAINYGGGPKYGEGDQVRASPRLSRSSTRHGSRTESSQKQQEISSPYTTLGICDRPFYDLIIFEQPSESIVFGATIAASVIISLQCPTPDMVSGFRNMDTSRFMAAVSLVTDTRGGERTILEHGSLTGQNVFDTVHPIPQLTAESLARNQPCRLALGYFSFRDLRIRQLGAYRLRVTLFKTTRSGAISVVAVDSDVVRVERHCGSVRKHQHI